MGIVTLCGPTPVIKLPHSYIDVEINTVILLPNMEGLSLHFFVLYFAVFVISCFGCSELFLSGKIMPAPSGSTHYHLPSMLFINSCGN